MYYSYNIDNLGIANCKPYVHMQNSYLVNCQTVVLSRERQRERGFPRQIRVFDPF